ncbi:hypothetical protein K438DRAFT_1866375 [Mycena galopus ATCC 62051]|nr:hypothetical protein K438DRAFT_1866375 [Mycena galopus ATCC 62051]
MASSLALIPWNQPDANKRVAKIDENSRPKGGRWGLVRHTLFNPSPGRTLDEVYRSLGKAAEKQANRVAYKLGLGPYVVANKIKAYFGDGEERVQRLELLHSSVPPKLEKRCSKLMKYTQPKESGSTQCQAFKEIVDLVTLFTGLRVHFLRAKCLDGATPTDDIAALWNRPTGSPDDDWSFWQSFAATCLCDTDISTMLEGSTVLDLFKCTEGTLGMIERLLVEHDSSEHPSYSRALCIRYLGGILDLPGFWSEMSYTHAHVASRLCSAMVGIFIDIGVEVLTLGPLDESEPPFDNEGVDFLGKTVLTGISNWLSQLDREQLSTQPWYDTFCQLVQLLRMPRAAELLPESSTCATTTLENILPTHYQDAKLNVTVNSENKTTKASDTNCDHSLADLHCNNDSTTSVHTKTSDQDAQDMESHDENREDAQSRGSSEVSSENGEHASPASKAESSDSDTQMDDVQDLDDYNSAWDIGQGSHLHRVSDVPNSGIVVITGANVPSSTPYPSLEALRKAAEQQKVILYDCRRDLGEDHPETLTSMESLAYTHFELGEYMAARDLRVVVAEKQQSLLGENNPDMLRSMGNLAVTYLQLGQLEQSQGLGAQVLKKRREVLGEDHADTLHTMSNLADTYRFLGRLPEAERLQTQVLEKQRDILGNGHPETLRSMRNLATIYGKLGRLTEAEGLEVQALEKQREALGHDHPDTLSTMNNLAVTYLDSGQLTAAEELLAVTIGKERKVLGEDHPDTLITLGNLASTYHNQGHFERAGELYLTVLEKQRKILGNDHPDTRWSMRYLADTYRNLQKVQAAEELEALLGHEEI